VRRAASGGVPFNNIASEYNLVEKVNALRGLMDTYSIMYPQIQGIDFRREAARLDAPVYILEAKHELSARRDLAIEWFDNLQAPHKRLFMFDNAGHAVAFEQFEEFQKLMVETVLPETYPGR